jgi:hypothetical protein
VGVNPRYVSDAKTAAGLPTGRLAEKRHTRIRDCHFWQSIFEA